MLNWDGLITSFGSNLLQNAHYRNQVTSNPVQLWWKQWNASPHLKETKHVNSAETCTLDNAAVGGWRYRISVAWPHHLPLAWFPAPFTELKPMQLQYLGVLVFIEDRENESNEVVIHHLVHGLCTYICKETKWRSVSPLVTGDAW